MIRTVIFFVAALAITVPAHAQQPRVPVPLIASEGYPACSTAFVRGLEGTDGFLAVRAGPSMRERTIGRLQDRADVFACVRRGNWFGIVFDASGRGLDCQAMREVPRTTTYSGPCRSGWVHYNYLGGYADFVSP